MDNSEKIVSLANNLEKFYLKNGKDLLFHGWHHIVFVRKKSVFFAKELGANEFLVEASALVHDLNYVIKKNSSQDIGKELRKKILRENSFTEEEIKRINEIIIEENFSTRDETISLEAKALSDADTLFKALPITPILFTGKYITENNIDMLTLIDKILDEQIPLLDKGIYFYSKFAKENYLKWVKTNLALWKNVKEVLQDKDTIEMLDIAKSLKVL